MDKYTGIYAQSYDVQTALSAGTLHRPYMAIVQDGNYIDWNGDKGEVDYSFIPLTFKILSGGTISFKAGANATPVSIQYSLNNGPWTTITSSTAGTTFNVGSGDEVAFKGTNATYSTSSASTYSNTFAGTSADFRLYGNIMSLVAGDDFKSATTFTDTYVFRSMFADLNIREAKNLILPATALTEGCYMGMLSNCKFSKAPALPATTLAKNCYWNLFMGTITLTEATRLPAMTLAENCYRAMFYNTRIKKSPSLNALTLVAGCYYQMFDQIPTLNRVECWATDISATDCLRNWVRGCAATGDFYKNANTSWPTGNYGIPTGWTVHTSLH